LHFLAAVAAFSPADLPTIYAEDSSF